jgi:hypothetical protein
MFCMTMLVMTMLVMTMSVMIMSVVRVIVFRWRRFSHHLIDLRVQRSPPEVA